MNYLGINLGRGKKGLYNENSKTPEKEAEGDTGRCKDLACTQMDLVHNDHPTKHNLQLQCNPNQVSKSFLHRHRQNYPHV